MYSFFFSLPPVCTPPDVIAIVTEREIRLLAYCMFILNKAQSSLSEKKGARFQKNEGARLNCMPLFTQGDTSTWFEVQIFLHPSGKNALLILILVPLLT